METLLKFKEIAKAAAITAAFLFLISSTIVLWLLYPKLSSALGQADDISSNASAISKTLKENVTAEMIKNYDNSLNTSTYALQSLMNDHAGVARDVRDSIKLLNKQAAPVIGETHKLVEDVRTKTLPSVSNSLDSLARNVDRSGETVEKAGQAIEGLAGAGKETLEASTSLLVDRVPPVLRYVESTMSNVDKVTALAAERSPQFFDNVNKFTYETAGVAEEVHKFGKDVNKKESFFFKLGKLGITAALGNLRSIK